MNNNETRRDFLKRTLFAVIALPVLGQVVVAEESDFWKAIKPELMTIVNGYKNFSPAKKQKFINYYNEVLAPMEDDEAKEAMEGFRDFLIESYG